MLNVDQIRDALKKRVNLPSIAQLKVTVHTLPPKEKMLFLVFSVLLAVSVAGLFFIWNDRIAIEVPHPGGGIQAGIVGTPRFINPLIATSDADSDVAELVYAGLLKPDGHGGLINELAEKYEISKDSLTYTFTLKEDLRWQDGEPITSTDVAFTVKAAQLPLVKSPKRANWEGVEVATPDARTVQFILKKPYTPFLENATLQILPRHIWEGVNPDQFSLSQFNIEPMGAGPYKIKRIYRDSSGIINSYTLTPFDDYVLGRPYIKSLTLKFYNSETELINAYLGGAINSMGSVSPKNIAEVMRRSGTLHTMTLSRIFGVFFNQNKNKALADYAVRRAMLLATDKERIVKDILAGYGTAISDPIPPGTFGSVDNTETSNYNPEEARAMLAKAGWKLNEKSGFLEKRSKKETVPLTITLSTSQASDLAATAELLKSMWEAVGIKTEVKTFDIGDFDKNIIRPRDYDALLFGEVVGYDPDPFAFWHSSQRNDPGLNIALYANITVDKLLEQARSTADATERAKQYLKFQAELRKDLPAIFLYSPYYLYAAPGDLRGLDTTHITAPHERFAAINSWYMETKKVWKFLLR